VGLSRTKQRIFQGAVGLTISVGAVVLSAGTARAAAIELETPDTTHVVVQISTTTVTSTGDHTTSASGSIGSAGGSATGNELTANTPKEQSSSDTKITSLRSLAGFDAEASSTGNVTPSGARQTDAAPALHAVAVHEVSASSISMSLPTYRLADSAGRMVGLRYGNNVMPLQPVMTGSVPHDLATLMPTSTGHIPANSMPHPNSLLGQLTIELAGIVVPMIVLLTAWGIAGVASGSMATLIILTVTFTALTYGLWLRRSGFSTAARSDLPAAFTFAAPRLMGYDRGQPPRRT
jgi:hypothetical protein